MTIVASSCRLIRPGLFEDERRNIDLVVIVEVDVSCGKFNGFDGDVFDATYLGKLFEGFCQTNGELFQERWIGRFFKTTSSNCLSLKR
jgi:hypothetical protein